MADALRPSTPGTFGQDASLPDLQTPLERFFGWLKDHLIQPHQPGGDPSDPANLAAEKARVMQDYAKTGAAPNQTPAAEGGMSADVLARAASRTPTSYQEGNPGGPVPPPRLTPAQRLDLANDPRLQNPAIREKVFSKLGPEDVKWLQDATQPEAPFSLQRAGKDAATAAAGYVADHPVHTAATIGGIAGPAVVTGGASLPISLGASFLGGAGGAGTGMTIDALRQYFGGDPSKDQLPTTAAGVGMRMGTEGAGMMAAEGTGRLTSAGLRGGANLLMNEAVPADIAKGFPGVNIGDVLNRNGINPTRSGSSPFSDLFVGGGSTRARVLRRGSAAARDQLVQDATANGVPGITRRDVEPYLGNATNQAAEEARAGVTGGHAEITRRVDDLFNAQFPYGDIALQDAPSVTRQLQREGKVVRKAVAAGQRATDTSALAADDLANGVRRTTELRIPGYGEANKRTQEAIAAAQTAEKMKNQPIRFGGLPSRLTGGGLGVGELARTGDPISAALAASVPLALGTPQISAPVAINLYRAGKIPYSALLKVASPELLKMLGVNEPTLDHVVK